MTDLQLVMLMASVISTQGIERKLAIQEAVQIYKDTLLWWKQDCFGTPCNRVGKVQIRVDPLTYGGILSVAIDSQRKVR